MNLMDNLAVEKKAAQSILAKGMDNITEKEQEELKHHYAEAKKLQERIDLFKEAGEGLDKLAGASKTEHKGVEAKTLGDFYVKSLKEKGLSVLATKGGLFSTPEFKAASDVQATGGASGAYAPYLTQTDQNGVWPYERPLVIADLFASGTMSGTTIKYPVYGAFEGNATTVAEGGQKPQIHMPDPTWVSDSLHEIAAWWKITDDMAEDLPFVVSEINQHAQYNLKLQEEIQLLSGDGTDPNLNGILNRGIQSKGQAADSDPDRIFAATTDIATATGFSADAVVINPADYQTIRLSKDSNGQYFGGGFFSGQYGNGGILQNPPLWGLRTVVTEAMPQGNRARRRVQGRRHHLPQGRSDRRIHQQPRERLHQRQDHVPSQGASRPAGQVSEGFRQGDAGKSSEVTPDAESIAVTPDALAMRVGETARLEVSVLPAEASQEFTARIADPSIATIESEGL